MPTLAPAPSSVSPVIIEQRDIRTGQPVLRSAPTSLPSKTAPVYRRAPVQSNELSAAAIRNPDSRYNPQPIQLAPSEVGAPTLGGQVTGIRSPSGFRDISIPSNRDTPVDAPDVVDVVADRESAGTVQPDPAAPRDPSAHHYYDPWYSGWYVHPYYRNQHNTSAVWYDNSMGDPWGRQWYPNERLGWAWVPGSFQYGFWQPGYWVPAHHIAPRQGYVWTNGFWQRNHVYVDGYWRAEERTDGDWQWVEGFYLEDGSYVPGHWRPTADGPEGYAWEPGFWKGDAYVDGFWRPTYRQSFTWQSAFYDEDGVFNAGFWLPLAADDGFTWVPGWFDGVSWVEGYWVNDLEFDKELVSMDIGEGYGDGEVLENNSPASDKDLDDLGVGESVDDEVMDKPLGLPVIPQ